MSGNAKPLKFPAHYPPTNKWKKFFIGVRWLGPDLSFFKELETQQGNRSKDLMREWGGGVRQEIAEVIANILHKGLGWKSNVLLPEDSFQVVINGPKFDLIDDFVTEDAVVALEKKYKIRFDRSFWDGLDDATFGEVVDKIVSKVMRATEGTSTI